jgi:hypothetical protein
MRNLAMLAAGAVLFGAASAHADSNEVVFPAVGFGLTVGSTFQQAPGDLRVGTDDAIGGATVGGPFVTASGSAFTGNSVGATATWEYEIVGAPSTSIGILISGVYDAVSTGHSGTVGNIFVGDNFRDYSDAFHRECVDSNRDCTLQQQFSIETTVSANFIQQIEIQVGGAVTAAGGGDFSVTIDPIITLAPGFADQGYTLLVAPDAQPPAGGGGVPEPATWALMIGGFGLAGAALRRRRAAATA